MILPSSLSIFLIGLSLALTGCAVEPYAYQCGEKQITRGRNMSGRRMR